MIRKLNFRKKKLESHYECMTGGCANQTTGFFCDTCKQFSKEYGKHIDEMNRESK